MTTEYTYLRQTENITTISISGLCKQEEIKDIYCQPNDSGCINIRKYWKRILCKSLRIYFPDHIKKVLYDCQ